ncbi:thioredoxin-like fold domain-containing protein MRL7L, chloroplastic isoform X1 [Chenopodium quinoa]|uniref:thioredoxin-like fold domain-containing protein MRL7L, chloroplastic isoform X1 n=2 Tax=Chenopodium quinoa TaxID=63459 RepID=UPI000B7700E3|nr:thioredoxin-like fold domain-containing protein MRL7L, chloroplastic isoform X1 [Chenopodium quinoa]
MGLQYAARFQYSPLALESSLKVCSISGGDLSLSKRPFVQFVRREGRFCLSSSKHLAISLPRCDFRRWRCGIGRNEDQVKSGDGDGLMDEDERREWRKKIWDVIDKYPNVQEELDPEEKRRKMEKLLAEYPLVVEEEDPDWPEDADGRGFGLDQFFNKISIKNVKKNDDDDEDYDSDKEIVWQDDDYIRPIKDVSHVTLAEWEEMVFKDISPLIILVHNRYKRPKANELCRDELERAVNIIWNCRLPSPRCVAIDAVVDCDLVSALKVSNFPELIFTKSGKILYREKAIRPADELSKIMAYFYYGAAKPPFFNVMENIDEAVPSAPISNES